VSGLDVGDSLHAEAISLPEGVELVTDSNLTIAHVIASRVATSEAAGEGEAGAAGEGASTAGA
jgi:large subunit ribosomal protein L25